jgi:hypothetical protein
VIGRTTVNRYDRWYETERERAGDRDSLRHWQAEAKAAPANVTAKSMVERLAAASEAGDVIGALKAAVTSKPILTLPIHSAPEKAPAHEMNAHSPNLADAMQKDLRLLNQKIADVTPMLPEGSREKFIERAATYHEKIAERVDQLRAEEAKVVSQQAAQERQTMAPVVEKAEQVARTEAKNAQQEAKAAGRAGEAERKLEGEPLSATGAPAGLDQKRALLRETERQASTETQEVRAARDASRTLASDPAKPIPAMPAQGDRVAELRRKQAEMLEKLIRERGRSRERGHEAGD